MAQTSLLQGKRFYCREWVFNKIQHCLQEKANISERTSGVNSNQPPLVPVRGALNPNKLTAGYTKSGNAWGVLLVGGAGSGKTALCTELLWPTRGQKAHYSLHQQSLAFHFCRADDSDTLCVGGFIRGLVAQICGSGRFPEYEEKIQDPAVQRFLQFGECEQNPTEAFKRCVLLPLLNMKPPQQSLFLLVDSIDEGCQLGESEHLISSSSPRTIAELLVSHHELLPPWLLLIFSARKQNKAINKLFTRFHKISLDDLRKAYIVKDVQQYILQRLDQEEALRQHLTKETAEMLNQLHIKSSGCFLYLERVLDGVVDNLIMLHEIRDIPGTLNGLYLWLCQRLFIKKQFAKVQMSPTAVFEPSFTFMYHQCEGVFTDSPVLTSRVAVTVHVLDINEFPPELASPYETFVCENARLGQVIQTFSAKDKDVPSAGQQFSFRTPKEDMKNKNFTIRDFGNNTAGIVTKRVGFRRRLQEIYFLPVVIEDNGYPPKSSTGTLTIRVCGCESDGSVLSCSAEAIFLPVGLSTGALIAILLCIVILLGIVVLYVSLRRQKKKETLMSSKEDIRDNVIHYDDEGGGEEDTHAFDMGTLRNPKVVKENLYRRDVKPEMKRSPKPAVSQDSADIRDFIHQRLVEHDLDNSAPPYDSLATYAYEGEGSVAESLSSIESVAVEPEEDYNYLSDWGPRFKTLAGIFGEQSETQSDSTNTENTHG